MRTLTCTRLYSSAALISILFAGPSVAATTNWAFNNNAGDWLTASNWDNGVPTASDQANVPNFNGKATLITISGAAQASTLTLNTNTTVRILTGGSFAGSLSMQGLPGNNDIFDLNGVNTTIGDLTGTNGFIPSNNTIAIDGSITLGSGTLTVGTANSSSVFMNITGSGGLVKQGSGTLTLRGAGYSYTGGTTINVGTLALGQVGRLPVGGNVILNGGTLDVSQGFLTQVIGDLSGTAGTSLVIGSRDLTLGTSNSTTYAGNITGGFTKQGSGTLTLTGTVAGSGFGITAGTLRVAGGSITGPINIAGTLMFDRSDAFTYGDRLSGAGNFIKNGSGLLTILADSSAFTGAATLNAGTLMVGTASIASAWLNGTMTVNGGILTGAGTLGAINNVGGTVSPGDSVGTLTAGSFTQGANGTLLIEVTPATSDLLKVTGAASLGGTLQLAFASGTYTATQYTIVSGGSITGTFANVTGTVPTTGLTQSVTYDGSAVHLNLTNATIIGGGGGGGGSGSGSGSGHSSGGGSSGSGIAVAAVGVAAVVGVAALLSHGDDHAAAWSQAFGDMAGGADEHPFLPSNGGFLAGLDWGKGDGFAYGVSAGYDRGPLLNDPNGTLKSVRFGLYGGYTDGPLNLVAALSGGQHLTTPGVGLGRYDSQETEAALRASYAIHVADWVVTPNAGFAMMSSSQDRALGNSGALATQSLRPFIGAELHTDLSVSDGITLRPQLRASYSGSAGIPDRSAAVPAGANFGTVAAYSERDAIDASAGFSVLSSDNMKLFAEYAAHVSKLGTMQSVMGALQLQF